MHWGKKTRLSYVMLILAMHGTLSTQTVLSSTNSNQQPIADSGLTRYVETVPVSLDGTGSYDPDHSGSLSYL